MHINIIFIHLKKQEIITTIKEIKNKATENERSRQNGLVSRNSQSRSNITN